MQAAVDSFLRTYGPYLLALVGLVVADVITGIASAMVRGVFSKEDLANFYRTSVIPKLLGWVALNILSYMALASSNVLPGEVEAYVGPGVTFGSWGAVVLSLASSIYKNLREIYQTPRTKPAA